MPIQSSIKHQKCTANKDLHFESSCLRNHYRMNQCGKQWSGFQFQKIMTWKKKRFNMIWKELVVFHHQIWWNSTKKFDFSKNQTFWWFTTKNLCFYKNQTFLVDIHHFSSIFQKSVIFGGIPPVFSDFTKNSHFWWNTTNLSYFYKNWFKLL